MLVRFGDDPWWTGTTGRQYISAQTNAVTSHPIIVGIVVNRYEEAEIRAAELDYYNNTTLGYWNYWAVPHEEGPKHSLIFRRRETRSAP